MTFSILPCIIKAEISVKGGNLEMTVSYDKPWKLLIDRRMRKIDLVNQSGISSNAMAKMGKREPVTLEALWRICLTYTSTTIANIFDEYAAELESKRAKVVAPRILGIDEKHIVHNMRGVFVDIETGTLLEMTVGNRPTMWLPPSKAW